jgi:hypothetical protein
MTRRGSYRLLRGASNRTSTGIEGDRGPDAGDGPCVSRDSFHRASSTIGSVKPLGLLGLLLMTACATPRATPIRPDREALIAKAARAEAALRERFLSREGILVYRRSLDRPPDLETGPYGDLADAACWGGYLLGAEALRFASDPTPEARATLDRVLSGVELIARATGVPGLLSRTVDHGVPSHGLAGRGGVWRPVADPTLRTLGYVYRGDASKDQYAGVLFGLGCVIRHVTDPGLRRRAGRIAVEIASHLESGGLAIRDADGRVTTHGALPARLLGIPLSVNASLVLCAFRLSAEAGGPPEHRARYQALVADGWARAASHAKVAVLGKTNRNNDHMAAAPLYHLAALETDPKVRELYVRGLVRIAVGVAGEGNALFLGLAMESAGARRAWREEAWTSLMLFPEDRITGDFQPDADSAGPIRIDRRPPSSFYWRSDPYDPGRPLSGRRARREYSPCDFLVAYRLLFAHGAP